MTADSEMEVWLCNDSDEKREWLERKEMGRRMNKLVVEVEMTEEEKDGKGTATLMNVVVVVVAVVVAEKIGVTMIDWV